MDISQRIGRTAGEMRSHSFTEWERMPDIELYMDQVLLYVNKQLGTLRQDGQVTSGMVNNYVKDGLVEHPVHKRYDRCRLAQVLTVAELKQILQMPDILLLERGLEATGSREDNFALLIAEQSRAYSETAGRLADIADGCDETALERLALTLSLEAAARKTAAENIINALRERDEEKSKEKKHHDDDKSTGKKHHEDKSKEKSHHDDKDEG